MSWTYGLIAVYLVLWLVAFVDCIRRPRFYPMLGRGWPTRVFWIASYLFFNPVLTLWYLLFGVAVSPKPRASVPVRTTIVLLIVLTALTPFAVYGRAGAFPAKILAAAVVGQDSAKPEARDAGGGDVTVSEKSFVYKQSDSSRYSSASIDGAGLACAQIAVVVDTDHPLAQAVGRYVAEGLKRLPLVESVSVVSKSDYPLRQRDRLPDAFLLVELESCQEDVHKAKTVADVSVRFRYGSSPLANELWVANASAVAPAMQLRWDMEVKHHCETTGVSSADRYSAMAEKIGLQAAEKLANVLSEVSESHPPLSGLPGYCYGPWRAAEAVTFADRASAMLICSGYGLFSKNRSMWRIVEDRPAEELLNELRSELVRAGWELRNAEEFDEPKPSRLRMRRGDAHLAASTIDDREWSEQTASLVWSTNGRVDVLYEEGFSEEEIQSVISKLLDEDLPVDVMLQFRTLTWFCGQGVRDRWYAWLEARQSMSPRVLLELASRKRMLGQRDDAVRLLRKAIVLAHLGGGFAGHEDEIERSVEDLQSQELLSKPWTFEEMADLGALRVKATNSPIVCCAEYGRPVLFWQDAEPQSSGGLQHRSSDDDSKSDIFGDLFEQPTVHRVLLSKLPNGMAHLALRRVQGWPGSGASMSVWTASSAELQDLPLTLQLEGLAVQLWQTKPGDLVLSIAEDDASARRAYEDACGLDGGASICGSMPPESAPLEIMAEEITPATVDTR